MLERLHQIIVAHPYLAFATLGMLSALGGAVVALFMADMVTFYWGYLTRFLKEWGKTWKKEVSFTVVFAFLIFGVQVIRGERDAANLFVDTLIAAAIMLIGWGGFHAVRVPWLLQKEGLPRDWMKRSRPLGKLPVFPDDLIVELLELCDGRDMKFDSSKIFMRLRIMAKRGKITILYVTPSVTTKQGTYKGGLITDLSNWLFRTSRGEEGALESLWQRIQSGPFIAGEPATGWIGIEVPESDAHLSDSTIAINVRLTDVDGVIRTARFDQAPWPKPDGVVLDEIFTRREL